MTFQSAGRPPRELNPKPLVFVLGAAGPSLVSGDCVDLPCPYNVEATKITVTTKGVGDLILDFQKQAFVNLQPNLEPLPTDTICGGNLPTIVSGTTYEDAALSQWTTTIVAGDVIRCQVLHGRNIAGFTAVLLTSQRF
jgi:hypothetical protein